MQGKATYAGAWGQNIKLMSVLHISDDKTAIMHWCISLVFTVCKNRVVQAVSLLSQSL